MRRLFWLALAIAAGGATPIRAQGWIEVQPAVPSPRPAPIGGPVIRVQSDVRVSLNGRIAQVEVEERFKNAGSTIAEGTYLYPLSGEAVFTGFSLWMGDHELQGEMQSADQARSVYEEIVRRQRDPALLTYAGHGLIRAQIFPIQPGETRKVVLHYTQVLGRDGDALRLRYTIGPRPADRGQGGDRAPQDQFSMQISAPDSGAFGTPYSPTHEIATQRTRGRLIVTIPATASGDLDLLFPLRRGLVGTSILTHASPNEDGYYMLLLAPPEASTRDVIPRDLTLVVDVSGSMSGPKLEQAKAALAQALGALGAQDRFRLIAFSSGVTEFRPGLTPATRDNLADAQQFVDRLSAGGGTNIEGALDVALQQATAAGRLPLVVFMTDGLPSVGQTQPDQIASAAGGRIGQSRIFTVGVGTDVNTYLLDRLAREGRGSATYVAPNADVEVAVGTLLGQIRNPALVNLRVVSAPVTLVDAYPARLPDLFFGEELVVFGRYHGTGTGEVVIEGERNGRRERFTAHGAFTPSESDNAFVPPLWASRKIGELTRTARLEGATPALIEEIRQLGLRYGLLTEYTSFLVLEPGATPPPPEVSLRGGREDAARMSGQVAFNRAEASARAMELKTLASADAAAEQRLADAPSAPGVSAPAMQRLSGRVFVDRNGLWTDLAYKPGSTEVMVAPFSPAYFALVRSLPELAAWLPAGDRVVVAGSRVSIRIDPQGLTEWRGNQLVTTVRDFRGQ
jgi:Ca-activated chloride channel family protein